MAMSFDPFSDLDRLTGALWGSRPGARFMPVDLYRDRDRYILNADLPGVDPVRSTSMWMASYSPFEPSAPRRLPKA